MDQTRRALFLCAASCQGGHSDAGAAAAEVLDIPFPITMDSLVKAVRREAKNPVTFYPWLLRTGTFDRYFLPSEVAEYYAQLRPA